jgi:3-deoxy-D-manno-octulosonic-acid transferase
LDAILTQNEESVRVLKAHGIVHARCTGDGRIDRVAQLADSLTELPWLEQFKSDRFLIIAGSPWEPDEDRLIPLIDHQVDTAFLIAPHEVGKVHVDRLMKRLSGFKTARWTELKKGQDLSIYQVLVLDTIGLLSSCYRYGDLAFIGGGYTTGIHSIQEPAAHSCPVLFGPKHNRFPEANTLIERGGAWEIETPEELQQKVGWLRSNNEQRQKATQICRAFIEENRGASQRIGQALEEFIR